MIFPRANLQTIISTSPYRLLSESGKGIEIGIETGPWTGTVIANESVIVTVTVNVTADKIGGQDIRDLGDVGAGADADAHAECIVKSPDPCCREEERNMVLFSLGCGYIPRPGGGLDFSTQRPHCLENINKANFFHSPYSLLKVCLQAGISFFPIREMWKFFLAVGLGLDSYGAVSGGGVTGHDGASQKDTE